MLRAPFAGLAVLLLACQERNPPAPRASASVRAPASAEPRARRPAPSGPFRCEELRSPPQTENSAVAESIELVAPGPGKKVFTGKVDVVLTFDREEFLQAARCLKFPQAIRYLEQETGHVEESPIMDAFQLSFVVAAMLDIGRAGVRKQDESALRKSIVRDRWAGEGCAGHCRAFGRLYRLSEDDPSFFLRVTDKARNDWE